MRIAYVQMPPLNTNADVSVGVHLHLHPFSVYAYSEVKMSLRLCTCSSETSPLTGAVSTKNQLVLSNSNYICGVFFRCKSKVRLVKSIIKHPSLLYL